MLLPKMPRLAGRPWLESYLLRSKLRRTWGPVQLTSRVDSLKLNKASPLAEVISLLDTVHAKQAENATT